MHPWVEEFMCTSSNFASHKCSTAATRFAHFVIIPAARAASRLPSLTQPMHKSGVTVSTRLFSPQLRSSYPEWVAPAMWTDWSNSLLLVNLCVCKVSTSKMTWLRPSGLIHGCSWALSPAQAHRSSQNTRQTTCLQTVDELQRWRSFTTVSKVSYSHS